MLIAERAQQAIPHLSEMHGMWVYDIVVHASVHVPGVVLHGYATAVKITLAK